MRMRMHQNIYDSDANNYEPQWCLDNKVSPLIEFLV